MPWYENLDPNSPAYAIAASRNPRIRVIAGPGTGKSYAMKRRVARLLEEAVDPATILPVTFTRVAAADLHRELVGMGVPGCEELNGVTLHSLSLRILMRNHVLGATGRVPRPLHNFEQKPLEADLAKAHGGVRDGVRPKIKAYEAAWARLQHDDPGILQNAADLAFKQDLLSWFSFHRAMLIGEVIPQLYDYLRANPLAAERSEFRHILVDEFQDLNRAEQGVIELLSDRAEVCIVGDDDQSIYSFRHAHPEGIRAWLNQNGGADDLTLDECHRCPTQVVAMANALIANNVQRPVPRMLLPLAAKGQGDVRIIQYYTLEQEIDGVTRLIADMVTDGTPPGDILVLAQRGVIGKPIYEALRASHVPVRSYYAETELDAKEVQESYAFLRLFVDREDRVALRWLVGLESKNWFASSYQRLREYAKIQEISPWQALSAIADGQVQLARTAGIGKRFRIVRDKIDQLALLYDAGGMEAIVNDVFPDGTEEVRDLRSLALAVLNDNAGIDASAFLSALSTGITKPEVPTEIEDVRVMTLGGSKGLSAPVTIIAGCIEGLLPQQPDNCSSEAEKLSKIEEQRRLFYVGISRVKASPAKGQPGTLILTHSRQMSANAAKRAKITPARVKYGKANFIASRFLAELGPAAPLPVAG